MPDLTQILAQMEQGAPQAAERMLPLVYDELRKLAAAKLAQEKSGQMLQATALVHDAYVRLVGGDNGQQWDGRGHFFAAAAEAMRRILVENAHRKNRVRHGKGLQRHETNTGFDIAGDADEKLLALDDALRELAAEEPIAAEVVKLRYFAGLTIEQAARSLGISVRTANRHWAYAKAWLYQQLS